MSESRRIQAAQIVAFTTTLSACAGAVQTAAPDTGPRSKPVSSSAPGTTPPRLWSACSTPKQWPHEHRYRHIVLNGQSLHLGDASEAGVYNLFIFGAAWCKPCKHAMGHISNYLAAYPDLVITYLDLGEDAGAAGAAIQSYYPRNGLNSIPYAYLTDACGLGIEWIGGANETFTNNIYAVLSEWLPPPKEPGHSPPGANYQPARYSLGERASTDHGGDAGARACEVWEVVRVTANLSARADGEAWDHRNGAPDPQITIVVGDTEYHSPQFKDRFHVDWSVARRPSIRSNDRLGVRIDDLDGGGRHEIMVTAQPQVPTHLPADNVLSLGGTNITLNCTEYHEEVDRPARPNATRSAQERAPTPADVVEDGDPTVDTGEEVGAVGRSERASVEDV